MDSENPLAAEYKFMLLTGPTKEISQPCQLPLLFSSETVFNK